MVCSGETNEFFTIVDIDECREFHNLCINGRCLNEAGSYKCDCNSGYEIDSSDGNCTGNRAMYLSLGWATEKFTKQTELFRF
jgi:Calcium-binding EGF domain